MKKFGCGYLPILVSIIVFIFYPSWREFSWRLVLLIALIIIGIAVIFLADRNKYKYKYEKTEPSYDSYYESLIRSDRKYSREQWAKLDLSGRGGIRDIPYEKYEKDYEHNKEMKRIAESMQSNSG